jgi:hypothetical protein
MAGKQGLGSPNMSDAEKNKIQSAGAKASHSSGGAAGRTSAARRGGQNSRRSR